MIIEQSEQIIREVSKAFTGKDEIIRKVLMTIYAGGHILLEDCPGVGKTTLALAFSKALGTGVRGFSLREVSVLRDKLGAPFLSLSKKAAQLAQGYEISLSLTHTTHYASAVVILTKNQNERKE